MPPLRLWTRDEFILTFNLYLTIEYKKINDQNTDVIKFANLINRSPGSISIRLANFASVDPYHQQRGAGGLKNGGNTIQSIWDEFYNDREKLLFESEEILAQKESTSIENKYKNILFDLKDLKGETVIREIKARVNQCVFRKMVLTNYSSKCAITGIDIPELLFSSHIIPWSENENERLNIENGICFSALYDKAFDKGLIGINTNHEIIFSDALKKKKETEFFNRYFSSIENQKIVSAQITPRKEFLEYHLDTIFNKQKSHYI
ncbi:putative restriction endonuclease [Flavobacterium sp. CF108]|uniref:HNH endonuclease n=1 Tax=unclassified Flavobacterium TaxID=196869 RepID=UPI0008D3A8DF|nr:MULTISPECIES: HNH endonuclease signature motif containing protein [unclassified Flavobacterium]SEN54293.1 putative restriction endonuclease [Flavobacterium sp. fv08]SHG99321.1 putative restriction endonuclease [Flavobacterium sp. CF108]